MLLRRVRRQGLSQIARSVVFGLALLSAASPAMAEPLKLTLGGDVLLPLGGMTGEVFLPGVQGSFSVLMPVAPQILVGGRFSMGALMNGPEPQDRGRVDPGLGGLVRAELVARVRPFVHGEDSRRGPGLFIELHGGGALTGELVRPTFGAGLGWGLSLGDLGVAPVLRYQQVIQGEHPLESGDARLLSIGLEVMLGETAPPPPPEPPASDRDGDGLLDDVDACPDAAEDFDGFQDEDGCPDPDNDQDGVLDGDDQCINEPEDKDGFEDEDGCPDPDNDQDGFPDPDDQCPNEPEVVNGVDDYDGCPDEGLITMIDDRIILDERVLFDFERSRVKTRAKPTLEAIVNLQRQHPEWISVRVEGHTDARGNAEFNQDLSERRAANVRDALVKLGIGADLITSVGHGAARLRDMRETEDAHQRNRRVEFVVVARTQAVVGVDATEEAGEPVETAEPNTTPTVEDTPVTPPAAATTEAQP